MSSESQIIEVIHLAQAVIRQGKQFYIPRTFDQMSLSERVLLALHSEMKARGLKGWDRLERLFHKKDGMVIENVRKEGKKSEQSLKCLIFQC